MDLPWQAPARTESPVEPEPVDETPMYFTDLLKKYDVTFNIEKMEGSPGNESPEFSGWSISTDDNKANSTTPERENENSNTKKFYNGDDLYSSYNNRMDNRNHSGRQTPTSYMPHRFNLNDGKQHGYRNTPPHNRYDFRQTSRRGRGRASNARSLINCSSPAMLRSISSPESSPCSHLMNETDDSSSLGKPPCGRGRASNGRSLINCSSPAMLRAISSPESSPCSHLMNETDDSSSLGKPPCDGDDADIETATEILEDLKQRPSSVNIEEMSMEISDSSNSSTDTSNSAFQLKTNKIDETKGDSYFDKLYKSKTCIDMYGDGNITLSMLNKTNTFLKNDKGTNFRSKFLSKAEEKPTDNAIKQNILHQDIKNKSHSSNQNVLQSNSHHEIVITKSILISNEVKAPSDKNSTDIKQSKITEMPPAKCTKRRESKSSHETKSKPPEQEILGKSKEQTTKRIRSRSTSVTENKKDEKKSNSTKKRTRIKEIKHVPRRNSVHKPISTSKIKEEESKKEIVENITYWRPRRRNVITDSESDEDITVEIDSFIKENKIKFGLNTNEERKRKSTESVCIQATDDSSKKKAKFSGPKKEYLDEKLDKKLTIVLNRIDDLIKKDLKEKPHQPSPNETLGNKKINTCEKISTTDLLSTLTGDNVENVSYDQTPKEDPVLKELLMEEDDSPERPAKEKSNIVNNNVTIHNKIETIITIKEEDKEVFGKDQQISNILASKVENTSADNNKNVAQVKDLCNVNETEKFDVTSLLKKGEEMANTITISSCKNEENSFTDLPNQSKENGCISKDQDLLTILPDNGNDCNINNNILEEKNVNNSNIKENGVLKDTSDNLSEENGYIFNEQDLSSLTDKCNENNNVLEKDKKDNMSSSCFLNNPSENGSSLKKQDLLIKSLPDKSNESNINNVLVEVEEKNTNNSGIKENSVPRDNINQETSCISTDQNLFTSLPDKCNDRKINNVLEKTEEININNSSIITSVIKDSSDLLIQEKVFNENNINNVLEKDEETNINNSSIKKNIVLNERSDNLYKEIGCSVKEQDSSTSLPDKCNESNLKKKDMILDNSSNKEKSVLQNTSENTKEADTNDTTNIINAEFGTENKTKKLIEKEKSETSKDEISSKLINDSLDMPNDSAVNLIHTSSKGEEEEIRQLNKVFTIEDLKRSLGKEGVIHFCDYNRFRDYFYPILQEIHSHTLSFHVHNGWKKICQNQNTDSIEKISEKMISAVAVCETLLNNVDIIDFEFSKVIQNILEIEKCDYGYLLIEMMILIPQLKNVHTSFGKLFYNSMVETCQKAAKKNKGSYNQAKYLLNMYDPTLSTHLESLLKINIKVEVKKEEDETLVISDDEDDDCCIVDENNEFIKKEIKEEVENSAERNTVQEKYITVVPTESLMDLNHINETRETAADEVTPDNSVSLSQDDSNTNTGSPQSETISTNSTEIGNGAVDQLCPTQERPTTIATTDDPISRLENMRTPYNNPQNPLQKPNEVLPDGFNFNMNMVYSGLRSNQKGKSPTSDSHQIPRMQELPENCQVHQNKQMEKNIMPPQHFQSSMQYPQIRPSNHQEHRYLPGPMNYPVIYPNLAGSHPMPQQYSQFGHMDCNPSIMSPTGQPVLEGPQGGYLGQSTGNQNSSQTLNYPSQAIRDPAVQRSQAQPQQIPHSVEDGYTRSFPQPNRYWGYTAREIEELQQSAMRQSSIGNRCPTGYQQENILQRNETQTNEESLQNRVQFSQNIGQQLPPRSLECSMIQPNVPVSQQNNVYNTHPVHQNLHRMSQLRNCHIQQIRQNLPHTLQQNYTKSIGQHSSRVSQKNTTRMFQQHSPLISQKEIAQRNQQHSPLISQKEVTQQNQQHSPLISRKEIAPRNQQHSPLISQKEIAQQNQQHSPLISRKEIAPRNQHSPLISQKETAQQNQQHSPLLVSQQHILPLNMPHIYQHQNVASQQGNESQNPYVQRNNFSNGATVSGSSSGTVDNGIPQVSNAHIQYSQANPMISQYQYMMNSLSQIGNFGVPMTGTTPLNAQNQVTIQSTSKNDNGKKKQNVRNAKSNKKNVNKDKTGASDSINRPQQVLKARLENKELMPTEVPHSISLVVPTNNISDRVTELHIPDTEEQINRVMGTFDGQNKTPESSTTVNTIKELLLSNTSRTNLKDSVGGWWNQLNKQLDQSTSVESSVTITSMPSSSTMKPINTSVESEKKRRLRKSLMPTQYNAPINNTQLENASSVIRPTTVVDMEHQGQVQPSEFINERPVIEIQRAVSSDSGCFLSPSTSPRSIENADVTGSQNTLHTIKEYKITYLRDVECICGKIADLVCECNTAIYCSVFCQQEDWINHRDVCASSQNRDQSDSK